MVYTHHVFPCNFHFNSDSFSSKDLLGMLGKQKATHTH